MGQCVYPSPCGLVGDTEAQGREEHVPRSYDRTVAVCSLGPHESPALSSSKKKKCSWALRNPQVKSTQVSPWAPWGMNHQCGAHSPTRHMAISGRLPSPPDGTSPGLPRRGHAGPHKQGEATAYPLWLSGDHGTLSPGQGGTEAKKAEVEQADGQAVRGRGGAESIVCPGKITCSSCRKTSEATTTHTG